MSIKDKENKSYENRPNIEFRTEISKDGKYFIFRQIITNIKPVNYINKIQDNFIKEFSDSSVKSNSKKAGGDKK